MLPERLDQPVHSAQNVIWPAQRLPFVDGLSIKKQLQIGLSGLPQVRDGCAADNTAVYTVVCDSFGAVRRIATKHLIVQFQYRVYRLDRRGKFINRHAGLEITRQGNAKLGLNGQISVV